MKLLKFAFMLALLSVVFVACNDDKDDNTVSISFDDLTANGSETETTTMLTLLFSQDITDLNADDITLDAGTTGATKGELTAKGNGTYELELSDVSAAGEVTVSVSKEGYAIEPALKTVNLFCYSIVSISFNDLTANGSASQTTTMLTLQFSQDITDLNVDDITLDAGTTGATKGELTAKENGTYELELSDVSAAGEVTVSVAKEGYAIEPASKTVNLFYHKGATVYVAGYIANANGENVATLWKNGVAQPLSYGKTLIDVRSLYVSGSDVYVAGAAYNAEYTASTAILWKNGVAQPLTNGTTFAQASSIYVSGDNVYVAGNEMNANNTGVATLWKNGVKEPALSDETTGGEAHSVYVAGDNVYVAGYEMNANNKNVATLWKNGVKEPALSDGTTGAQAVSVYVSDGNVYVTGNELNANNRNVATIWKNGVKKALSDGTTNAFAPSVYVSDDIVYVAGNIRNANNKSVATLWKNGVAEALSDGTTNAQAYSVYVFNGDVYVAGNETNANNKSVATLWKNGIKEPALSDGTTYASAQAVFVVE